MEYFWVDSALLGIPNYAIEEELALDLFNRVIGFERLLGLRVVQLVLSDMIEDNLYMRNCGPEFEQIRGFLSVMELEHVFTPHDVFKSYQTILDRALRASDVPGFEVTELEAFTIEPQLPDGLSPAALRELTELALVTVSAIQPRDDRWCVGSALPIEGLSRHDVKAVARATRGPRAQILGDVPLQLSANVRSLTSLADLASEKEANRIWQNADSPDDLYLAICILSLRIRRGLQATATVNDLIRFSIGTEFFRTLVAHECHGSQNFAGATLNRCAQIVADSGAVKIDNFAVERRYDKAIAQRVHISKKHQALRLMFWKIGQSIEFANVGAKKELEILTGDPRLAFAENLMGLLWPLLSRTTHLAGDRKNVLVYFQYASRSGKAALSWRP